MGWRSVPPRLARCHANSLSVTFRRTPEVLVGTSSGFLGDASARGRGMELVPYAMSTLSRNLAGASDEPPLRLVAGWGSANDRPRRQSNHPSRADGEDGITIYADPRFKGPSYLLFTDIEDPDDVEAGCFKTSGFSSFNFDDGISSIRVPPGLKVTVCEDPHYRGASVDVHVRRRGSRSRPGAVRRRFR
jgi:hypothetical protein